MHLQARMKPPLLNHVLRGTASGAVLALFLGACVGDAGPIEPGRYSYEATHPAPGGEQSIQLEGFLQIDEAPGDTIEGEWEVPQLHPELRVVEDEGGAAVITAHPTYFGTLHHRIRRGSGGGVSCSGEYVWVAEGGEQRSVPLTCTIQPER